MRFFKLFHDSTDSEIPFIDDAEEEKKKETLSQVMKNIWFDFVVHQNDRVPFCVGRVSPVASVTAPAVMNSALFASAWART